MTCPRCKGTAAIESMRKRGATLWQVRCLTLTCEKRPTAWYRSRKKAQQAWSREDRDR